MDETPIPEHPEVVIFASYRSTPKYPVKVSVLGENVSQICYILRQYRRYVKIL